MTFLKFRSFSIQENDDIILPTLIRLYSIVIDAVDWLDFELEEIKESNDEKLLTQIDVVSNTESTSPKRLATVVKCGSIPQENVIRLKSLLLTAAF